MSDRKVASPPQATVKSPEEKEMEGLHDEDAPAKVPGMQFSRYLEVSGDSVSPRSSGVGAVKDDIWEDSTGNPSALTPVQSTSSWRYAKPYVIKVTLMASICSALLGYDIGITSGALIFVSEDFSLTTVQQEVFVGILNLVSLVGALVAGRLSDYVGRRVAMATAAGIFFAGALFMALAPDYTLLIVGRVITGVGVGFGLSLPPLYIAEVAPHRERGGLVSFGELFINLGILLGFLVSFLLAGLPTSLAWRWMLGLGVIPAIALMIALPFVPESPRWLIMHGQVRAAEKILIDTSADASEARTRYLEILDAAGLKEDVVKRGSSGELRAGGVVTRKNSDVAVEGDSPVGVGGLVVGSGGADGDVHVVRPMEGAGGHGVWKEILWPTAAVRRMLVVMVGTNFFQQATGIDAAVYYSPVVFRAVGLQSTRALLGATLSMGVTKVAFIIVSSFLLDHFGRRPLLLASTSGMTVALVGLGCAFLLLPASSPSAVLNAAAPAPETTSTGAAALAISSVCLFVAFFSIGLGPINWLLTSEIFPLRLRAQAIGIGTAVNRVASGAVAMSFLSLADATGRAGPFFIFAVMGVLAFFFFLFFAPETRGRTLEQIVKMFDRRTYAWHPEEEEVPSVGLAVFDGNRMQQGWGTGESSPKREYRSTLSP